MANSLWRHLAVHQPPINLLAEAAAVPLLLTPAAPRGATAPSCTCRHSMRAARIFLHPHLKAATHEARITSAV